MGKQREKYIKKISRTHAEKVLNILLCIQKQEFDGLDIKPLTGKENMYRCRIGELRAIFYQKGNTIEIKSLLPRGDIYKN